MLQLCLQAFLQIACANAYRVELLDTVQHGFDLIVVDIQTRVEVAVNVFCADRQVAVIIY